MGAVNRERYERGRLTALKQIYDEAAEMVTSSKEEWKSFLRFAAGVCCRYIQIQL